MFDFLFGKDIDIRDEAIMEMLSLLINHAHIILKDWKEDKDGWDREAVMLATVPLVKLGELKALQKYLKTSDVDAVQDVGDVLMRISKTFREEFLKKEKDE